MSQVKRRTFQTEEEREHKFSTEISVLCLRIGRKSNNGCTVDERVAQKKKNGRKKEWMIPLES